MKAFKWFIAMLYWLQLFAAPMILFGIVSLLVYSKTDSKIFAIILLSVGCLIGIFLAEFIRRKYGLEKFFAKLYGPAAINEEAKN